MEGQAGRSHTPPLNVELAGGWEAWGGDRSKHLASTWPTVFWSLTLYCHFLSILPCRQHETSLQVEQRCVYQLAAKYMGNAGLLVEAVTKSPCWVNKITTIWTDNQVFVFKTSNLVPGLTGFRGFG